MDTEISANGRINSGQREGIQMRIDFLLRFSEMEA